MEDNPIVLPVLLVIMVVKLFITGFVLSVGFFLGNRFIMRLMGKIYAASQKPKTSTNPGV